MTVVSVYQSLDQTAVVLLQSTVKQRRLRQRYNLCWFICGTEKENNQSHESQRGGNSCVKVQSVSYDCEECLVSTLSTVTRTYILL